MSLYKKVLRPLAFKLQPELAHEIAMAALGKGLIRVRQVDSPLLRQAVFGKEFANPLGLAAGFDKNAVAVDHWHKLGFGFMECGTVTNLPQPGNPKPRLFRLAAQSALINRMGFNNDGAAAVGERLSRSAPAIPLGINIGKSKFAELNAASSDYRESFRKLNAYGDYSVVNVSSPNTAGLRELQDKTRLAELLDAINEVNGNNALFVKISPDLDWKAIDDVVEVCLNKKVTGLIATNTTSSRGVLEPGDYPEGGLSGKPLRPMSDRVLKYLHRNTPSDFVLIGVGGIASGDDLFEKIAAGAHLCQVYTGWVYGGPSMVPEALERLLYLLDLKGFATLEELRGSEEKAS